MRQNDGFFPALLLWIASTLAVAGLEAMIYSYTYRAYGWPGIFWFSVIGAVVAFIIRLWREE